MTKKRQTSIISSNSNAQHDTTLKENENKCSFSSSPLNVSNSSPSSSSALNISKPQLKNISSSSTTTVTTGLKSARVSAFMRKDSIGLNKKKILRENVTASSALSNQHLHSQYHQIPHKKIRVSSIASNSNNANVVVASEKDSFDSELPCCSRSIPAFSIYSKAPSSPSGSSSSSNSGQVKITSFMPLKKPSVVKYSKPLGATKKSRSELIAPDGSTPTFQALSEKIIKKKKRLLTKSDATPGTLKRKKSRSQKPLV